MKKLLSWVKAHPYKALGFALAFDLTAACTGAAGQPWWFAGLYAVLLAAWWLTVWRDSRSLLIAALAIVILRPTKAEPLPEKVPVVGMVVGTVVVVAGGVVIYKVVRFCQRHFSPPPEPTNAPPAELDAANNMGASCSWTPLGSCWVSGLVAGDQDAQPTETTVTLTVTVDDSSGTPLANLAMAVEPAVNQANLDEFEAMLASWGVYYDPIYGVSYGLNGLPCAPWQVPVFSFSPSGMVTVDFGGTLQVVTVERSTDLQTWEPVLQTQVSAGHTLQITDSSFEPATFYRASAE